MMSILNLRRCYKCCFSFCCRSRCLYSGVCCTFSLSSFLQSFLDLQAAVVLFSILFLIW